MPIGRTCLSLFAPCAVAMAVTATYSAALAQQLPGSVTPGQIEKRFDPTPQPRSRPDPLIEWAEPPTPPDAEQKERGNGADEPVDPVPTNTLTSP